MSRKQYEVVAGKEKETVKTNKGLNLMLFNDRSYSMEGLPFNTLK